MPYLLIITGVSGDYYSKFHQKNDFELSLMLIESVTSIEQRKFS